VKGISSYEYVECVEKLKEAELSSRETFYIVRWQVVPYPKAIMHTPWIWQQFFEYSDLYLKTYVLLADIFENFRDSCITSLATRDTTIILDPAYYYPGFYVGRDIETYSRQFWTSYRCWHDSIHWTWYTWRSESMFKHMRRPITSTCNRMIHWNPRHNWCTMMSITCMVVNHCHTLDFRWIDNVDNFDVMNVTLDSSIGSQGWLGVSAICPWSHSILPFRSREKSPDKREEKLLAILYNKKHYVLHYRNLHDFASISNLIQILKLCNDEFEKNLFKLMNNAILGKIMENVHNHVNVQLVMRWDGRYSIETMIEKPNFYSRSVFSENMVVIEMRKVKFDKPIYVGICILDISKNVFIRISPRIHIIALSWKM